ncbi:MAG: hypothetical protein U9N09_01690 [Euryarchaeota archaeon]|nr:hypothetical protein [Euryarchaeota archaeon]
MMRRSERLIANLSGTGGEAITETATSHHRLHDPAAACRIVSTSIHEPRNTPDWGTWSAEVAIS